MKQKILDLIEKHIKKDIYIQKRDRKLLMIKDYYNNVITEYQKIINLLDKAPNQPFKFRTRNWIEINDEHMVCIKISKL